MRKVNKVEGQFTVLENRMEEKNEGLQTVLRKTLRNKRPYTNQNQYALKRSPSHLAK